MTANYPASILPPNATAVERAIDRASAAALARLPVYLIRWVKDPDSCPLALLPWLAWEYQVDTWNINWSEQKKRDAIKRAHYIHRHRGTVAAVRHALVDSPFGTDIVEWFNQNPKGDPYTFRLNVFQNDLPVTEYDQQDLKLAVLRARNLRSWFSVHVFGRLQGTSYAAGYMYATEKITPRFVPLQVILSRYELNLAPGDSETVTVTILPEYAEDKTFTVTTSDKTIATARIVDGAIVVTGMKRGTCSVTVTTTNGVSAVIGVKVVAVMKFITQIDNANRPLFFVRMDEDFTIDYGDGIDGQEYRFEQANDVYGWAIPTRELTVGEEYLITVKNSETASFQRTLSNVSVTLNTVREIICVTGNREHLVSFAAQASGLIKIHEGAFDDLPAVKNCSAMFSACSSLTTLPAGVFTHLHNATNFSGAFAACQSLTALPDGLFDGLSNVTTFSQVFSGCSALVTTGNYLFRGCAVATLFERAFDSCTSLTTIGQGIFAGCVAANSSLMGLFRYATRLTAVPDDLFDGLRAANFEGVFFHCAALAEVPPALFRSCASATSFREAFAGCTALKIVPDQLFAGLSSVNTFYGVFSGCTTLTDVGEAVFRDCIGARDFNSAFSNCRTLKTTGVNIFAGCTAATGFDSVFYWCDALTVMPSFADCHNAVSFFRAFSRCESLPEVPADAFAGKSQASTFQEVFAYCYSLTRVNAGAFRDCISATSFGSAFAGCRALTYLAPDIFTGCHSVAGINSLFSACTALTTLPDTLFSDFSAITQMASVFHGCKALTELPPTLLASLKNLTVMSLTFAFCEGLHAIPATLLADAPRLTSVSSAFLGCTGVTSLPAGLFDNNPLLMITHNAFQNSGLTALPEGLFANNPLITVFSYTFSGCSNLTHIPADLARYSERVTQFSSMFAECISLTDIPSGLFNGAEVTSVYGLFDGCTKLKTPLAEIFDLESYPGITATAFTFRECRSLTGSGLDFINKVPAVTLYSSTFTSCYQLDDYDQLPDTWK